MLRETVQLLGFLLREAWRALSPVMRKQAENSVASILHSLETYSPIFLFLFLFREGSHILVENQMYQ